jgi:hypothetical protein
MNRCLQVSSIHPLRLRLSKKPWSGSSPCDGFHCLCGQHTRSQRRRNVLCFPSLTSLYFPNCDRLSLKQYCLDSGDLCLIDVILVDGTHSAVVHYTISDADNDCIGADGENSVLNAHLHDPSTYTLDRLPQSST